MTSTEKTHHGNSLVHFRKDARGLSTVEYVIILVLIAVTAIVAWRSFGRTLLGKIKMSNTEIQKL